MNIRAEPKRNSEAEIKRRGSLRCGFGCGESGWEGVQRKDKNYI